MILTPLVINVFGSIALNASEEAVVEVILPSGGFVLFGHAMA
jgi:hypothetical protein